MNVRTLWFKLVKQWHQQTDKLCVHNLTIKACIKMLYKKDTKNIFKSKLNSKGYSTVSQAKRKNIKITE